jgi:enoyl-CoA hydratase
MELENIKWETKEQIAIITLNRPKVLNALNSKTLAELDQIIMRVERDSKLMAAVITGSGDRAFSSGADAGEIMDLIAAESPSLARRGQAVFSRLENMEKPVVAAINGFALSAGCELALACTFRVAAETAKFGLPEVKRGIIPGYGGTQRLPRLIGKGRALEIILTGRMIDAREAYQIGLVNKVVPETQLMEASIQLVREVIQNAPIAIRMALQSVNQGINMDLERGLAYEANLFGICFTTEDKQEGIRAFREKRPPQFKGR